MPASRLSPEPPFVNLPTKFGQRTKTSFHRNPRKEANENQQKEYAEDKVSNHPILQLVASGHRLRDSDEDGLINAINFARSCCNSHGLIAIDGIPMHRPSGRNPCCI